MKTLTKLSMFLAAMVFALGTFNMANAQTPVPGQGAFERITTMDEMDEGWFIVANAAGASAARISEVAMGTTIVGPAASGGFAPVPLVGGLSVTNNRIDNPTSNLVWHFERVTGNTFTVRSFAAATGGYMSQYAENRLALRADAEERARWVVSWNTGQNRYEVQLDPLDPAQRLSFRSTQATPRFMLMTANYGPNDQGFQFFKWNPDAVVITASSVNANFGDVLLTEAPSAPQNIVVSGSNLTGNISLALEGPDVAAFTVNEEAWTATGGTLGVTFNPTEARAYSASIRLSTAGANDVVISLAGRGVDPVILAWNFSGMDNVATAAATTRDANLSSVENYTLITRGADVSGSQGNHSFRSTGFGNAPISVTSDRYFQVIVNAIPGQEVSLSLIQGFATGTATFANAPGVTTQFAYSLDGTTFTLIGTPQVSVGTSQPFSFDVSEVAALQNVRGRIWLRYYATGQTTTGGWGLFSVGGVNARDGLAIHGTFEGYPMIVADRNEIDFDEVFAGILTATETIEVTAAHFTEPITFAIEGIDAAAFSYDDTEWATSGTLEITFAPDEVRPFEASIRFTTTGAAADLSVPLVGVGIDPTDPLIHIAAADMNIDLGTAPLNTNATQMIAIQGFNLEEDIAFVLADNVNFSVAPDAGWNPRDGGNLTITFNTETPGLRETTLTITSAGATTRVIELAGVGIAPVLTLGFRNDMVHLVNTDVSTIQVPITADYLFENITIESSNPLFVPSRTTLPTSTTTYMLEVEFTGTTRGETATVTISTGDTVRTQMFLSITDDVLIGWNFQNPTAEGRESNFGTAGNLGVEFIRDAGGRITDGLGARAGLVSDNLHEPMETPRYWQAGPINTTEVDPNYTLILTHRQSGSNTGPRDWQLQYRIGTTGEWVNFGEVYSVVNQTNPRPFFKNVLPEEANNVAELYLRWLVASDERIYATGATTTVAAGGTSHMSEVFLTWESMLVADRHNVDFGNRYIGTSTVQSVIVTGINLPYPIAVVDAGLAPNFTVATDAGWDPRAGGTLNITFAPTVEGQIRAVLYIYVDDERKDSIILTGTGVEDPTSICPRNIAETTVALFPNPVVDVLNIVAEQAIALVRIYNLAGQVVVQQHGNRDSVDMSTLPRGTYVVRIVFEDGTILTRTVVK